MKVKIFKTKKSFKKRGIHFDPAVYWGIFLFIGFALVIAAAIFGFYLFQKVNRGFVISGEEGGRAQVLNKERIEKSLQYFSLREEKALQIIDSTSPVIDPSL
ncbi:MAG TPA: hypothetical protein VEA37_13310 [Flavobacterium sp.]|nr:hypothetical protein [Flavobacterium sp.]